jgi:hypothetical protein
VLDPLVRWPATSRPLPNPHSGTQKLPVSQQFCVKQTLFAPQSALVVHGWFVQTGVTHAVPPPTMVTQSHSPCVPHGLKHDWVMEHGPETT